MYPADYLHAAHMFKSSLKMLYLQHDMYFPNMQYTYDQSCFLLNIANWNAVSGCPGDSKLRICSLSPLINDWTTYASGVSIYCYLPYSYFGVDPAVSYSIIYIFLIKCGIIILKMQVDDEAFCGNWTNASQVTISDFDYVLSICWEA